jgi:LPS O-antigen subunit length determinant protein (WzzB/FepE family)
MEVQINQRMLANVTHEYAFRVADRALPPDPDDEIRPNKPFLLLLGWLFGMMVGAAVALMTKSRRSRIAEKTT